jgi:YfiR/HmsC-like
MALLRCRPQLAAALALTLAMPAAIPAPAANEYEVKAAFLFNFTLFVDWPQSSASGPFCIGIDGPDPFAGALDEAVKGRSAGGHAIAVKHFKPGEESVACEIVFISGADVKKMRAALGRLQHNAVLTVGEGPGFCHSGGVIAFEVEDNKVRLDINPEAAQRARLQISSKLLSLATLVRDTGE